MNIILAVIGFSILFKIGFDVPPPVVGQVYPNSPAQRAGVQVGDRVLEFDGRAQRDFTKIQLNVALVKAGESVPMVVQHPDGNRETLHITAERSPAELGGFLALGIMPSQELRGLEPDKKMLREME
jgi:membrane-associated protease RseP (regulator of RpoE activity)